MSSSVIWHDLECGRYEQDLDLWRALAERYGSPILDVGAGTGRVSVALAAVGHTVVALDNDAELLDELRCRTGSGQPIETLLADARTFALPGRQFPLVIAPMQTLQLLGDTDGQVRFLSCARAHLEPGGVVAVAIADAENFEEFEWQDGDGSPLPDIAELGGVVFSSQPTAVRRDGSGYVLERRREMIGPGGDRTVEANTIRLESLTVGEVEHAARRIDLRVVEVLEIQRTLDHIGSEVVILGV